MGFFDETDCVEFVHVLVVVDGDVAVSEFMVEGEIGVLECVMIGSHELLIHDLAVGYGRDVLFGVHSHLHSLILHPDHLLL